MTFLPPRRTGLIFHIGAVIILGGLSGLFFVAALQQEAGMDFVFSLLLSLFLMAPLPLLIYRGYALLQASYQLDRDGLRLRWGLRAEDIPLAEVEWVRPVEELGMHLPLPILQWPGAIIGNRRVEGLGPVEFMASGMATMLLVATPRRIFAISPADSKAFVRTFYRTIELGSLSPLTSYSTVPAVFLRQVLADRPARILLAAGLGLNLVLLLAIGMFLPIKAGVSLGFDANRLPLEPVSTERALLLPVLAALAFIGDFFLGLFLYRRGSSPLQAYLVWGCGAILPLLLLLATFFIW